MWLDSIGMGGGFFRSGDNIHVVSIGMGGGFFRSRDNSHVVR